MQKDKRLTEPLVRNLVGAGDLLDLDWYDSIDDQAAEALRENRSFFLKLSGLSILSNAQARSLSKHGGGGWLLLNGLKNPSEEVVDRLSRYKGLWLALDGIQELSVQQAASLSRYQGRLSLNGLTSLGDSQAEQLSQHHGGFLSLNGLTTISDAAAHSLRNLKRDGLWLLGLRSLSLKAAESLAEYQGYLEINLSQIPEDAAAILRAHPFLSQ